MIQKDLTNLINQSDHLAVLRYIRTHKLREPQLIVSHGTQLFGSNLSKYKPSSFSGSSSTGGRGAFSIMDESERLAALEQICIASTQVQEIKLAEEALTQIQTAVGKESLRYRRLLALCLESSSRYDDASDIYHDLLKDNPANTLALKRQYCILRAQVGMEEEARNVLNSYLERNGTDAGAWAEMAKTCADMGDYAGAAYCYEEIVLSCPLNPQVHCTLAEWYATAGGLENTKLARKHFCQSLELAPPENNLRALFGLVNTVENYLEEVCLKKNKREYDDDDVEMAKDLLKYGQEKLSNAYKGTQMKSLLTDILGN